MFVRHWGWLKGQDLSRVATARLGEPTSSARFAAQQTGTEKHVQFRIDAVTGRRHKRAFYATCRRFKMLAMTDLT